MNYRDVFNISDSFFTGVCPQAGLPSPPKAVTLVPNAIKFFAAFISLSWVVPHSEQVHSLMFNGSSCGTIQQELPLNIREWTCDSCGSHHDRDINAAKNLMALGTSVTAFGGDIRPACGQTPVKKETAIL